MAATICVLEQEVSRELILKETSKSLDTRMPPHCPL